MKFNTTVMRKTVHLLFQLSEDLYAQQERTIVKLFRNRNILDQEVRRILYPSKIIEDAGVLFQCLKPDYSGAS